MVQWPGRRGHLVKWKTPFGKGATYVIYGIYGVIAWHLIPYWVFRSRKKQYEQELLEGRKTKPWDKLTSVEAYFAFFGWDYSIQKKKKIKFDTWEIEESELPEGVEPAKLLHDLSPQEVARLDFEDRQKKIEDLRRSFVKGSYQPLVMPFKRFVFGPNAIFEN